MAEAVWARPEGLPGMVQHPFRVSRGSSTVPAVAWYADTAAPSARTPLVLLGHGGSGHKCGDRNLRLAGRLVRERGFNAVAIDGPFHGDRSRGDGFDYQAATVADGVDVVTERMVDDWIEVLEAVERYPSLGPGSLGYLGLSMGSRYGLALAARLGTRLSAVVLGKYGTHDSGLLHPGLNDIEGTVRRAGEVRAPVLLHVEENDEIFPLDAQSALFEAFASEDKTLLLRNGMHGSSRPDDESAWLEFLVSRQ